MEPCAVVASTSDRLPPDQIIKAILNVEKLPEPVNVIDGVRSYPWHIVTKYYEADIRVCALDKKTIGSRAFADSVNAVIICFDSTSDAKLTVVEQWLAFTKEFEPEVQILVCDQCRSEGVGTSHASSLSGVSKVEAQQWCVRNGFELVELNPDESEVDSDVEDDFPESVGVERIVQALQAHLWPNLVLKENHKPRLQPDSLQGLINGIPPEDFQRDSSPSSDIRNKDLRVAKVKPMPKSAETEVPASSDILRNTAGVSDTSHASVEPSSSPKLSAIVKPLVEAASSELSLGAGPAAATSSREIGIVPPLMPESNNGTDSSGCSSSTAILGHSDDNSVKEESAVDPQSGEPTTDKTGSVPLSHPRDERIDAMLEAFDSMPEDSFEQLFQNLSAMKSRAANLSPTERKAYAEKMAIAFWKSIGGNESEVDNISSDDDIP